MRLQDSYIFSDVAPASFSDRAIPTITATNWVKETTYQTTLHSSIKLQQTQAFTVADYPQSNNYQQFAFGTLEIRMPTLRTQYLQVNMPATSYWLSENDPWENALASASQRYGSFSCYQGSSFPWTSSKLSDDTTLPNSKLALTFSTTNY